MQTLSFRTALLVLVLTACGSPQSAAQEPAADPARAARLRALHDRGVAAPLELYPVRVLGRPNAAVADALGLVLEQMGLADLQPAGSTFDAADAAWDAAPARFAEHVRAAAADGGAKRYAVYAEFLGEPRTGPTEVRFVVVDAGGAIVVVDRQTPADATFRRTAGRDPDPLGCSRLVAERLFELADWQQVPGGVEGGRYAARLRQQSGVPDDAELAAMRRRAATLAHAIGEARLAVMPPLWPVAADVDAPRFAAALREGLDCGGVAAVATALRVEHSSNQQKRLWDLARAARAALKAHPIDADYAIAAEMAVAPERNWGFVNFVVLTRAGDFVVADFQNDQHPMFQRLPPKSLADCERFVARRLRSLLR